MKAQIKKFYSEYLSKYVQFIFNIFKKGPSRFVSAKSIPVSENYDGLSITETYNIDNVSFKPPFCLKELSQEKYLENFPNRESLEKNGPTDKEVGIISASKVTVVFPGYFPLWEGKIFEEATASLRFSRLTNIYDMIAFLKYELKLMFSKKVPIKKEAIYILGAFPQNYYHWLIQMLPKLRLIENNDELNKLDIVLPQKVKGFVKESLEIVGYSDKVIFLDDGVYEFDKLHMFTRVHSGGIIYPETIEWIKNKFIKQENSPKKRRIYISRQDTKLRRITNEPDIQPILDEYGFETFLLSNYSIKDKVKIFQEAEMVIGPCGSGFTHQVFANENTVVIEIFSDDQVFSYDYLMAMAMKQHYGFLIGSPDGEEMYVEPQKVKEIIELGLSYLN